MQRPSRSGVVALNAGVDDRDNSALGSGEVPCPCAAKALMMPLFIELWIVGSTVEFLDLFTIIFRRISSYHFSALTLNRVLHPVALNHDIAIDETHAFKTQYRIDSFLEDVCVLWVSNFAGFHHQKLRAIEVPGDAIIQIVEVGLQVHRANSRFKTQDQCRA